MRFVFLILACSVFTSCGKGSLRSPGDIKAITDTFTIGSTTIQNVYDSLGQWSRAGQNDNGDEFVIYRTSDGEVTINFALTCDDGSQNCKPSRGYDPAFPSHLYYNGTS